jgi:hypothetical protein
MNADNPYKATEVEKYILAVLKASSHLLNVPGPETA